MAYGTVADWQAYASARGNDAPAAATPADASAALERASDYIRTRFVLPQGLDGAAENVIEATYIAASLELATPGLFGGAFGLDDRVVLTKVQGIEWTPLPGANDELRPVVPAIEALLKPVGRYGIGLMAV